MFNPPWATDLSSKPLPTSSTSDAFDMAGRRSSGAPAGASDQQPAVSRSASGPYQYFQAPVHSTSEGQRHSYAERAAKIPADGLHDDLWASDSAPSAGLLHGGTTSEELSRAQHVNSTALPGSSHQEPITFDDDVPENLRAKPWSPAPPEQDVAEDTQDTAQDEELTPEPARRGSVPHRSPLQKLEGHLDNISKEEKRARVEDAENSARKRSLSGHGRPGAAADGDLHRGGTLRSEKGRVVSDGSRRPSESASDRYYQDLPEQTAAGPSVGDRRSDRLSGELNSPGRMQGASSATATRARDLVPERQLSSRDRQEQRVVSDPRPYHHAPPAPRDMGIKKDPRPYHHAPPAPRDLGSVRRAASSASGQPSAAAAVQRSYSAANRYSSVRDAEAAAIGASGVGYGSTAAERGRAAHERRKSREQSAMASTAAAPAPIQAPAPSTSLRKTDVNRNTSVRSNRDGIVFDADGRPAIPGDDRSRKYSFDQEPGDQRPSHREEAAASTQSQQKMPETDADEGHRHGGRNALGAAGAALGFGATAAATEHKKEHRFSGLFHRHSEPRTLANSRPQLEEWRNGQTARLTVSDLEFAGDTSQSATVRDSNVPAETDSGPRANAAWWEKNKDNRRSDASATKSQPPQAVAAMQVDGVYEEKAMMFNPPLFLKCGPLLRYTGIRREQVNSRSGVKDRVVWRGTVMIVTDDAQSDLRTAPLLRIFAQPMDLVQPPPHNSGSDEKDAQAEYDDPVAGQVKVSRTGRPLFVRPIRDINAGVDLSREENNRGLYSATRSLPVQMPQSSNITASNGQPTSSAQSAPRFQDRIKKRDGERARKYREVKAFRLHVEHGFTFWRFNIEIELGSVQHRVAYRINSGPALGFWVPGRAQSMNVMFHSCNGFSLSVDTNEFCGPDPLWRDVMNKHQIRPFHLMIGGGDQLYMDAVTRDTRLFGDWIRMKNPEHKRSAQFTPQMHDELETFYLNRYAMWFSQGLFAMAGSQIPMVNIWDDHDIIDGYGSYPHHIMASRVFTGLGAVAFKYYMLFQHQSLPAEGEKEEPSWVMGASPGPYIAELSRSIFLDLGPHVKFLGIDCRTERTRDEILSQESYELLFDRCEKDIVRGETKHLLVLLGVPIAYPRLNFLENVLTSRVMDPIKALGRTGMLGGFVNKFDGGVEILDDLDDHWTAKHHKGERNWLIQELQEFAAEKSVRVTILGGDVHLGAVGQFYSPRKLRIAKDKDHRYMPNVISSAIVNTPPPPLMADILNRRNKVHHLDGETDEDLIPMFEHDVDGTRRNNKSLLPRRNYCTIREFMPGSTPPSTPQREESPHAPRTSRSNSIQDEGLWSAQPRTERDRRFPPGSMLRTMSLTRGASNLVRRLSGSSRRKPQPANNGYPTAPPGLQRSQSLSNSNPVAPAGHDGSGAAPQRPTFAFHRRPTNFSAKEIRRAAAKGGAPEEEGENQTERPPVGHLNLEGGLDIALNMEMDQHHPGGHTQAYRLLVPALFYDGPADANTKRLKGRRVSFMQRLTSVRRRKEIEDNRAHRGEVSSTYNQMAPHRASQNVTGVAADIASPAARPTSFDTDGANEQRVAPSTSVRRSNMAPQANTSGSYDKGYNLSSPPIGAGHETEEVAAQANNPYPSRRMKSVRIEQPGQGQDGRDRVDTRDDGLSENSLTPLSALSGPSQEEEHTPPRRFSSKVERFYGLGDDGPPQRADPVADPAPKKKRFSWGGRS